MSHRHPHAASVATLIVVAAGLLVVPTPVDAQDVILSPVPKDPCCFTNFRFAGTCRVIPRQGQYCENILSYLNNFNSAGESYCNSTYIRGGWTLIDCASGATAGEIGFVDKKPHTTEEAGTATAVSPTMVTPKLPQQNTPKAIDSNQLQVTDASVIQVRLETPLEGDKLAAGQELTGRLEADVFGPDGELLAPAGSTISARVGAEHAWDSPAADQLQLQLVGTTTSAADLFGSADAVNPPDDAEGGAPSIHLTGDLVELSQDSVLTFQLKDVSEQPADMRVLTTATSVWMEAFNARDAVTIAGLSSEDGALLPPNGRAIIGRDAIYHYWKGLLTDSTTRVELVNVETVIEGDLGYKAGRFELLNSASGSPVDQGKYMEIWKRSPQGYWELHRDMWNSSVAQETGGG
jgi:ketosteroid isomerase-like protein